MNSKKSRYGCTFTVFAYCFFCHFVWERVRDARTLVMLTYLAGAIHRREVVIVIIVEWRMQIRSFAVFVLKMVILDL